MEDPKEGSTGVNILVYTNKKTERLLFSFDLIFREILGAEVEVTEDEEKFLEFSGPRVNYSDHRFENEFWVKPVDLLFQSDIREFEINVFEWSHEKVFFRSDENASFPFDPFAASFYLVSRYEEYLPHIGDPYGRFRANESLAYEHGFLHKPVVDKWAYWIRDAMERLYPDLEFPRREYHFISTIDIDNAFAYKQKGLMRTVGAYLRSLLSFDLKEVKERTQVLWGIKDDPYDTFELQLDLQRRYDLEVIYFFLLADYGFNDKNVPVSSNKLRSLIKSLADYAKVGIHPSFNSNYFPEKLRVEINRLADIVKREVTKSRQHFLILNFPDTYRRLLDLGIEEEYSMGFASDVGFRAGTCSPFQFFDLEKNTTTKLRVYPFAVMEATLKYYLDQDPEEATETIRRLIREVKEVDGTFVSLWHNESMSERKHWKGWRKVYEEMVKEATSNEGS